jgi:hypothetical protein
MKPVIEPDIAGNPEADLHAIAAEFPDVPSLYHAAEKLRDLGFRHWDTFSPFPIHGMNEGMGLSRSKLGVFVFLGGLSGFTLANALQFFTSWFIYPLVVAGKPTNFFSVPAFFPIMFELTILLSAFTAVFGMLILNGLPRFHHPLFNWERFKKVTDDGFFIAIEAEDPQFSRNGTAELLASLGGSNITLIHDDEE